MEAGHSAEPLAKRQCNDGGGGGTNHVELQREHFSHAHAPPPPPPVAAAAAVMTQLVQLLLQSNSAAAEPHVGDITRVWRKKLRQRLSSNPPTDHLVGFATPTRSVIVETPFGRHVLVINHKFYDTYDLCNSLFLCPEIHLGRGACPCGLLCNWDHVTNFLRQPTDASICSISKQVAQCSSVSYGVDASSGLAMIKFYDAQGGEGGENNWAVGGEVIIDNDGSIRNTEGMSDTWGLLSITKNTSRERVFMMEMKANSVILPPIKLPDIRRYPAQYFNFFYQHVVMQVALQNLSMELLGWNKMTMPYQPLVIHPLRSPLGDISLSLAIGNSPLRNGNTKTPIRLFSSSNAEETKRSNPTALLTATAKGSPTETFANITAISTKRYL